MKYYNIEFILYPNSTSYNTIEIIEKAKQLSSYCFIYHDKDLFTKKDEEENPKHKVGTLKSPHYHLLCFFPTQHSLKAYSKKFEIEENNIEIIKNKVGAIQYLIHKNNKDKYQYDINDISSNFDISKYFNNRVEKETQVIYDLFSYIENSGIIFLRDFYKYVIDNDYWSDYRRNAYCINKLIEEHNLHLQSIEQSSIIKL